MIGFLKSFPSLRRIRTFEGIDFLREHQPLGRQMISLFQCYVLGFALEN
jgi:hypothetical protein